MLSNFFNFHLFFLTTLKMLNRRVHFGGEEIKLRTPESDETSSALHEIPKTRIPLPVFPATRMPRISTNFPRLTYERLVPIKLSHFIVSDYKKPEVHYHDGSLSPKKSILCTNKNVHVESSMIVTNSPKKKFANPIKVGEQTVENTLKLDDSDLHESCHQVKNAQEKKDNTKETLGRSMRHRRSVSPDIFGDKQFLVENNLFTFKSRSNIYYPTSAGKSRERVSKSVETDRTRAKSSIPGNLFIFHRN